jgi:chitooligosaccharide deacetylase
VLVSSLACLLASADLQAGSGLSHTAGAEDWLDADPTAVTALPGVSGEALLSAGADPVGRAGGQAEVGASSGAKAGTEAGTEAGTGAGHSDREEPARSRVGAGTGRIAVTFDDGPDPAYTPHVLDLLAAEGVPATFFVIGRNAVRYPRLIGRMLAEGHTVANHTRDHLWLDRLAAGPVAAQVDGGTADLLAAGAPASGLLRPPRGWTSPVVAQVAAGRGLTSVFWTVCLEAHLHGGVTAGVEAVVERLTPGAILLCHDGGHLDGPNPQSVDRSATVAALPRLLRRIRDLRLQPVALDRPTRAQV